jgi:hypothetical protein
MKHPEVLASEQIYKTAREHADVEMTKLKENIEGQNVEQFILGALTKIDYDNAHNKLLKYALLYQYKQKKEYLKGGKSWADFLESIGEERKNIDRIFEDLRPLFNEFQDKMSRLSGIPFSKIRYLGKSNGTNCPVLEGDCILINGEKIPLNHTDEIEAAIDAMKDTHKKEKEQIQATLKAKDRIIKSKDEVINKQEQEIARHERALKERDFAPGEEAFLKQLANIQTMITGNFYKLDPEEINLAEATPRMIATYIELTGFISRWAVAIHDTARTNHGNSTVDGGWTPTPIEGQLTICDQCKAAHPECFKCCNLCLVPCNSKQICRFTKE